MRRTKEYSPEPLIGLLAGFAGGLVAAFAMNQFQSGWSKLSQKLKPDRQGQQQSEGSGENATTRTADAIVHAINGKELEKSQKQTAGSIVHYVFGASMGALYGAVSEYYPEARVGFGTLFGAALFLFADEIAVPALGLSGSPTEAPLSSHAYALVSHFVYGITAEGVRKGIRLAA